MEYFILGQDSRIMDAIKPLGASGLSGRTPFQTDELLEPDEEIVQFYLKASSSPRYVDFIQDPGPLVSDGLKLILEKYQPQLFFKPVVLADRERQRQTLYWLMVPDRVNCLSADCEINKDGTVKRLVIDERKVNRAKVFRVAGIMEQYTLIRLDVAESLLRRDFYGIRLQRVRVA